MSYKLNAKILQDLAAEHEELVALLKTMCKITAPSIMKKKGRNSVSSGWKIWALKVSILMMP